MRRTAAGFAVTLLAAVAIGGPLASGGHAATDTLRCATATPPSACALLDDLAAQVAPIATVLGAPLASLTGPAQELASRSDQPAGVPTAEVATISEALLGALGTLPGPVQVLVGQAKLTELTATLEALVDELTAPAGGQQAAETSQPTPATATTPAASSASPRTSDATSFGGVASTSGSSSSPSSAGVPDVPVGDPLTLAPLALPDFGFSQTMEPVAAPANEAELALAEAVDALPDQGRGAELAVVVVLSLLLIGAAGIAQLQQDRHTIPD